MRLSLVLLAASGLATAAPQDSQNRAAYARDHADALAGLSYAVVDVEATGGRIRGGDRITEVAVVEVKNGVATTIFDTLINPERAIPPWVSRLTSISWQMVKDAPVFADVCDQLLGVLDGRVFVAHNANFDWRFLTM